MAVFIMLNLVLSITIVISLICELESRRTIERQDQDAGRVVVGWTEIRAIGLEI